MKHYARFLKVTKLIRKSGIYFSFLSLLLLSCEHTSTSVNDLREVCFDSEILPLLKSSCSTTDCHGAAAKGGYRFDSYSTILQAVDPGDYSKSKLYSVLVNPGEDHMPPGIVLPQNERMLIRVWIDQGAKNTICLIDDPDTTNVDTTGNGWSNSYVCFERDILPLLTASCGTTGCHDAQTHREGYNFTTYAGILGGLIPGNPAASELYKAITEDEPQDIMPPPPYSPLTQPQIDSIYQWIIRGALDEDCGDQCDTTGVSYTTHISAIISTSCTGCHSGSSPQGGVSLTNYTQVVAAVNNGQIPAVLSASNGYSLMPPSNPLSDCKQSIFLKWIDNGMPE